MDYSGRKRKRLSASSEENSGKRRRNTLDKWNVTIHSGRRGDDERKDIIRRLDDRSMHQVISKVCDYLDYESLVNAEKVSPEWRQILSDDLIWKRFLERKVAADSTWRNLHGYLLKKGVLSGSQRQICRDVAQLESHFFGLVSSSVGLLRNSVKIIKKIIELFRLFGFGTLAQFAGEIGHDLDSENDDD